jgi:exodeoxyribonuclease VIII
MEQGVYHNIPSKDYHSWTNIVSNSYLGRLGKVPANALIPQEETEAMKFGRAFHCYVLEDIRIFWESFVIPETFPTKPNSRSTQKTIDTYNSWKSELDKYGLQPITQTDFDMIKAMNASVHYHPSASKFLAEGISETTLIWKDAETGLMCKARPDRIPHGNKGVILIMPLKMPFRAIALNTGMQGRGQST